MIAFVCVLFGTLPGWQLRGSHAGAYAVDHQASGGPKGNAAVRLSTQTAVDGFGTLMQAFAADDFRGKRVRFSALLKTDKVVGWSGLWMRIDAGTHDIAFDNMQQRALVGSLGWSRYAVVLDVAVAADRISIGVLQSDAGSTSMSEPHFDIVGNDVALTDMTHARLALPDGGFEDALAGWMLEGEAATHYRMVRTTTHAHSGRASVGLERAEAGDGYATIDTDFRADAFRGKRVRASVWVKTENVSGRGDFWVRARSVSMAGDGPGLDGGGQALVATSDWTFYAVVFDVPELTFAIDFGVGIAGPGRLWFDDAHFEIVDPTTPLTRERHTAPQNLSLSN